MRVPRRVRTQRGKVLTLNLNSSAVREGGEGYVVDVKNRPATVAKIYKRGRGNEAKLKAMLQSPPPDPMRRKNRTSIAWPNELIQSKGNVVGFLMPKARGDTIYSLIVPRLRADKYVGVSYDNLVRVAINLVVSLNAIHRQGHVVSDINSQNILVDRHAVVCWIDCDSFQINDNSGRLYSCDVGRPEYTPPEHQGKRFSEFTAGFEHDRFAIAVLIFQLLMEGYHPFDGTYLGSGEQPAIPERIASRKWPHSAFTPKWHPPGFPPTRILSLSLRRLFERCFEDGLKDPSVRPTCSEWASSLKAFEDELEICRKHDEHVYRRRYSTCPWCYRVDKLNGKDYFPPRKSSSRSSSAAGTKKRGGKKKRTQQIQFGPKTGAASPTQTSQKNSSSVSSRNPLSRVRRRLGRALKDLQMTLRGAMGTVKRAFRVLILPMALTGAVVGLHYLPVYVPGVQDFMQRLQGPAADQSTSVAPANESQPSRESAEGPAAKTPQEIPDAGNRILLWKESALRTEPSGDGPIDHFISDGSMLVVEGKIGSFFKVRYGGTEGYIEEDLVHPGYRDNYEKYTLEKGNGILLWKITGLRLRPRNEARIVGWMQEGAILPVTGKVGDYFEVEHPKLNSEHDGITVYLHESQVHPDYR